MAELAIFEARLPAELATSDSTSSNHVPIRIWTVKLVEAKTKKPLSGIMVDADVAASNQAGQQSWLLISDAAGEIKISLRKGQCTSLNVRGPGWCHASGIPFVGDIPAEWKEKDAPAEDPAKPITVELYHGVEVKGRLLLPDGSPAANVSLSAGAHCNQTPWVSEEYIKNLMTTTYSVGDWSNWFVATETEADGTFSVTVPPTGTRSWIHLGTIMRDFQAVDTSGIEKSDPNHPLLRFAPFEVEVNGDKSARHVDESTGVMDLGDLKLSKGIVLRGRVVDADGKPMSGVTLFTSGAHGPYAGRKTVSTADGSFEFRPMNPGTIELSPDAHYRDEKGSDKSRDVRAIFLSQEVTLREEVNPLDLTIRALPYVELAFDWVDRRAKKGPVAYYGGFTVTGEILESHGKKAYWSGETVLMDRDGRQMLVLKVPEAATRVSIGLHPDQLVTPSYSDDLVERNTGQVELSDIKRKMRRVIYGDEPRAQN